MKRLTLLILLMMLSSMMVLAQGGISTEEQYQWNLLRNRKQTVPPGSIQTPVPNGSKAYCTVSAVCDEFISNVTVGTINNTSACGSGGYTDYTALSTTMNTGSSYTITVTNGPPAYTADQCGIWIDWNQNQLFDDAPITVAGQPGGGPYTATIIVPGCATPGPTRMRVRIIWTGVLSPCGSASYGETEDYTINVVSNLPAWDAGVTNIITPNNSGGCSLGANEPVQIQVSNFGANTISNFIVFYRINGGAANAGLVTSSIPTCGSATFTFPAIANLSATGSYNIEAWTLLPNDVIATNDTSEVTVSSATGQLEITIRTDNFPGETSWKLFDALTNAVLAQGGAYANSSTIYPNVLCIDTNACLDFEIYDSYGDGICCSEGNGYFTLRLNSALIDSGGSFASSYNVPDITGNCPIIIDASVEQIYAYGKIPLDFVDNISLGAFISNEGTVALTDVPVKINVTGVQTFADTQNVSIPKGAGAAVTFDPFTPLVSGADIITVSVPADADNSNNSRVWSMQATSNIFQYADTAPVFGSLGFSTSTGIILCKYSSPETKFVRSVQVFMGGTALGKSPYAVVMNSAGTIVATSLPKLITAADTSVWVNFDMTTYAVLTNPDFYVGLALPVPGFFPVAYQREFPVRTGAYYYIGGLSGGIPTDAAANNFGRHMISCEMGKGVVVNLNAAQVCNENNTNVGLEVKNFNAIASFSLMFEFDTSRLTYLGIQNINANLPGVLANKVGKQLRISWVAPGGGSINPVTLPDGKIFDIQFNAKASGSAILAWDLSVPGANEIASLAAVGIGAAFTGDTLLIVNCASVTGSLVYDNSEVQPPVANRPLANVNVQLIPGDYAGITNGSGIFNLGDVPLGNYGINVVNTKPWGGGNALDGLVILKHFVGIAPLSGLKLKAADCNGDNAQNSQDALLVSNRFVGLITKFTKVVITPGDTQFIPLSDWVYQYDFLNLTKDTVFNFKSVCRGDANGSYNSFAKAADPQVEFIQEGSIPAAAGIIDIPVKAVQAMSLGAVALVIDAPAGVEILDASFASENGSYIYNVLESRQLRISWFSLTPFEVEAGQPLLTIKARIHTPETNGFVISENSLLADGNAQVIKNAKLSIPGLTRLDAAAELALVCYPNPFTQNTTITFNLPEAGNVSLRIYNLLGEEVATLINGFKGSGIQTITVSASTFREGAYLCRLSYNGSDASVIMLINK